MAAASPEVTESMSPFIGAEGLYEVVGTRIMEKPLMGAYEYQLAFLLGKQLDAFASSLELGQAVVEMLFNLRPMVDGERRPDVAFVSADRWPIRRRAPLTAAWAMVPDLAIEIASPTIGLSAVLQKIEEYFKAGSRLVWIVIPQVLKVYVYESPVLVTVLAINDTLDGGTVLPGFRMTLRDLFGDLSDAPMT
jgi:Uma2 family endonuclease